MSIEFHRHCQATVLSANGTGSQNGESWYIINELSGKLSNLPNGWIDYFKQNKQCITEDFASILNIINNVSGNVVRKIKLNNVEKTPVNGLVDLGTIVPQASNENCVDRRGDTNATVSSSLITNSVINVTDHEVYLELSDNGDLLIKKNFVY